MMDTLSSPPSSTMIVGLATAPSIVWLSYRFTQFLTRQYKPLKHHLKLSLSTEKGTAWAFAVHVLTALPLLLAAPFLAYSMIPPEVPFSELSLWILQLLAISLIVVNASVVFWILPHPSRYSTYGVTPREFMRGLAILQVAALQFTAMPLSCLVFLTDHPLLKLACAVTVPILYFFTILICACEWISPTFAWEHQFWARPFLSTLGYGIKNKSKLATAFSAAHTPNQQLAQTVMFSIFGPVGIMAMFQSLHMLWPLLNPRDPPVSRNQELYFVVLALYLTLIMSSGFFTMGQTMFDAENIPNAKKKAKGAWLTQEEKKILAETLLTQALPLLTLAVGPEWMGVNNYSYFLVRFLLWKAR